MTQAYTAFKYWAALEVEKMEMNILESSFGLENRDDSMLKGLASAMSDGTEEEGDAIEISPEHAEAFHNAMEQYIKER